jgi:hypothetical protein
MSITGRSGIRAPGSNPLPGGVRGVSISNPGRVRNVRRVVPASASRGKGYSDYETNLMLDIVEEILPHGQEMWVRCAETYQSRVENEYEVRDADSLEREMAEKREERHAEQNRMFMMMMMQMMNNQRISVPVTNSTTTFTTPPGTTLSSNLPPIKEVNRTEIHDEQDSKYDEDPWKIGDLPKSDQI